MAYEEDDTITASGTISKRYDAVTALLLGIIWDECEKEGRNCSDSYTKLADRIGVSSKTIERKIQFLLDEGLIFQINNGKIDGTTNQFSCKKENIMKLTTDKLSDPLDDVGQNVVPHPTTGDSASDTHEKIAEVSEEEQKEERFQKNKKMFLEKFYSNRIWDDEKDFWLKVLFARNENSQKKVYASLYDAPKRLNGKEMTEYLIDSMKKYANVR